MSNEHGGVPHRRSSGAKPWRASTKSGIPTISPGAGAGPEVVVVGSGTELATEVGDAEVGVTVRSPPDDLQATATIIRVTATHPVADALGRADPTDARLRILMTRSCRGAGGGGKEPD